MSQNTANAKPRWTHAFQRLWKIHWIMVCCFLLIYPIGLIMTRLPTRVASFRVPLYTVHKSIGVLILALLLIRIFTVLQVFGGKYLKRGPKMTFQWMSSLGLHTCLYIFMLIVPISGIWLSNSGGHPVPFFFITLPNIFPRNSDVYGIAGKHIWLAYTLVAFVAVHALEQHKFIKRTWKRWFKGTTDSPSA